MIQLWHDMTMINNNNNTFIYRGRPQSLGCAFHEGPLKSQQNLSNILS